ncbi:hypothetical protein B566_EDAN012701 [Ephemera danica]|nr:hypothetical protein B566_EDAN012701 [Ephemera danica]
MYKVVLFIAALQVLPLLTTAATSHSDLTRRDNCMYERQYDAGCIRNRVRI